MGKNIKSVQKRKSPLEKLKRQKILVVMSIITIIYYFIFTYWPLRGWIMAFQTYRPKLGYLKSPFVGIDNFVELFTSEKFLQVIRNTLAMSSMNLIFSTFFGVFLALVLNEVRVKSIKKIVQTTSYLPHFVSWVVASSLFVSMLSNSGIINRVLIGVGLINNPISFLAKDYLFWGIIVITYIWKNCGYGSIIYISAITGIDESLYEAAAVDGAGRWNKILNITLPGIMPTVVTMFVINTGWLLSTGFEQQMLMGNPVVYNVSEVLDLFTLRYGIDLGRFSFSTAAGMFKSVVSIMMVMLANKLASRSGYGKAY